MSLVLVTGAAGNLGRSLVSKLLARGDRVRAFDLPTKANEKTLRRFGPNVEIMLGDVTSRADVERAVSGIDALAHLAGILPPMSERNERLARAVNLEGTRLLVGAAERMAPRCPFVFASSYTVHGPMQAVRGLATADSPTQASDVYTATKIDAERIVRSSSLAFVILRVAAAIEGSASVSDSIVLRLMFEIDPNQPIELVHGDDVATAFANAISEPRAHRRTFPIGGGPRCQLRQREMIQMTLGAIGVRDLPRSLHGAAPNYTCWLDTTEAESILRFQHHDLEAIRRDLLARLGVAAHLARFASPLVRAYLLHHSGPYNGAPARPTFRDHIGAGH